MFTRESELHTTGIMYRCTAKHREEVATVQKLMQKEKHWGKVSVSNVMQRAIRELHESLIKPVIAAKPILKKKSIIKPKAIKK